MKHTNRRKHEKIERLLFVCMLVTSYKFKTTTRACVSEAHWRQMDSLFVDISLRFIARDFRVVF